MVGGIIQDQQDGQIRGQLLDQKVEKGTKAITVFLLRRHSDDLIGDKVVGIQQMMPLLLTWCGNAFLCPLLHPTSAEDRV